MTATAELRKSTTEIMEATVHAVAMLTLHLTGASRLPHGEVQRLTKLLKQLLEAIDALPRPSP